MSRDCRYICQRAANAIISEVGPYRVSTDALHGINQFLDEFLVQLLVDCQSLDLSRIKASIFNLLPSTLGKNAIVEAELEVKTFTETEEVDYTVYEKMRSLGQHQQLDQPSFPTKICLTLLRGKCLEFCTLADKDDQQYLPQKECSDVIISPIVAIYVTTVLEHMAEYILTAVAMTAETEDTDYVRIKELFLALVDDIQVGMVFQAMDLRDKMEKRSFAHGYLPRSSIRPSSTPILKHQVRYSTRSMNHPGCSSKGLGCDQLDVLYDDDDNDTISSSPPPGFRSHTPSSNCSTVPDNISRSAFVMPSNTPSNTHCTSSKRSYKVFKKDHHNSDTSSSGLASFSVYDPDAPTMNFEDLIRSGNTMRVSLTPNRLKSIETKNQMTDDPAPTKFAWKRRSSSGPRRSTGVRSHTPTSDLLQCSLVKSGSTSSNRAANNKGRKCSTKAKSWKSGTPSELSHDTTETHLSDASSLSSYSSTNKICEKSLPTPTSSTSSRKSKKRPPVPSDLTLPSSPSIASSMKSTSTRGTVDSISLTPAASTSSLSSASSLLGLALSSTACGSNQTVKTISSTTTLSPIPVLRRSSLSSRKSRESIRRQKEKSDLTLAATVEDDAKTPSYPNQQRGRSLSESAKSHAAKPSSSLQRQTFIKEPRLLERCTDTAPERPSSYVAKRISTTSSSHAPTPYESYAINNAKQNNIASTQKEKPASFTSERPISTAGTVGNTVKQLDQMLKQRSLSSNGCPLDELYLHHHRKSTTSPSPSLSNLDIKSNSSLSPATTTTTRSRHRQYSSPLAASPQNATFRRSMVLDKVLLFERAHSLDDNDVANRRASSYIPRRERFMNWQRDPTTLERPKTAIFTNVTLSSDATALQPIVRPGTSAAIAAAAARFAAGVSMAIQTDTSNVAKPATTKGDTIGNRSIHSSSLIMAAADNSGSANKLKDVVCESIGTDNAQGGSVSEHGVMDGDEEWFLPEDEWEDTQEQELAVVDWLLGEA